MHASDDQGIEMAANTTPQPDFAKHYRNKRLSDVKFVLCEEPALKCTTTRTLRGKRRAPASAAAVTEELPGHAVVLMAMSGYCCAAVSRDW